MRRLSEHGEDCWGTQLMMGEVLQDVCIEAKDSELVQRSDASQELHDEDFVFEGKASVMFLQEVIQLFAKSLGVMQ